MSVQIQTGHELQMVPGPKRAVFANAEAPKWRINPWPTPVQPDEDWFSALASSAFSAYANFQPVIKTLSAVELGLDPEELVDFDLSDFVSGDGQFTSYDAGSFDPGSFDPGNFDTTDFGSFDPGSLDTTSFEDFGGLDRLDFGGVDLSGVGDALGGLQNIGGGGGGSSISRAVTSGTNLIRTATGGGTTMDDDFGGGGMVRTGGLGTAMAAGGIWLGTYLARALGRGASAAVFTAANGVRVRLAQLWPLVRQYGPTAVAGALGIGAAGLGELLARAPTHGYKRKKGRGISARDIKTTRHTIRQLKKLVRMSGIRMGGGYRGGGYRSYRPRRRYY